MRQNSVSRAKSISSATIFSTENKSDFFHLKNQEVIFNIQVALAIRGAYVPKKFSTENTKTAILSLK